MNDSKPGAIGAAHMFTIAFSVYYLIKYIEKKDDTAVSNNTKNAVLGIGITIICLAVISLICLGFGTKLLAIPIVLCLINLVLVILGMVFTSDLTPPPPKPKPKPNPNLNPNPNTNPNPNPNPK
jgi:tellurite resistance protein TehA-like permease